MKYLVEPWHHQLEAIERAKDVPNFALFMEMGTGKTSTAINILRHKAEKEGRLLRTLVFAPPIVLTNWKREFRKSFFDKWAFQEGKQVPRVFITNFEALLMAPLFEAFRAWMPEVIIYDEAHKLKDHRAKRSIQARILSDLPSVKHRYILTGTPVLKDPRDLFAQFRVMDCGATFGQNFWRFQGYFCVDKNSWMRGRQGYYPKWVVREGANDEINRLIYKSAMRVKKEECLDLPPLVRQTIHCEMTDIQKKLYEEMKKNFITYIDQKAVVAELAITKALRLLQISSGYVKFDDGDAKSLENTPKQIALKELLEEITPNHKVIVWAVFKENYEQIRRICKESGLDYTEVHGEIPPETKFANVDRFNTDPNCRVFIGNPGSGGIGINLVSASYSIFYSRNFSLEQDLQAESRNHRGGSEIHERVTRIDLITTGTIDQLVMEALAAKQAVSEEVLKEWRKKL
jgi:SNF2 family DNA or RNA helicase